jgi:hypothetical protein
MQISQHIIKERSRYYQLHTFDAAAGKPIAIETPRLLTPNEASDYNYELSRAKTHCADTRYLPVSNPMQ